MNISKKFENSVLNVEVSYYSSYEDPYPVVIPLINFLVSAKHKARVEVIRSIEDKGLRDEQKALLPAITPSGVFSYREAKGLIRHSGLVQLDVDFKDNQHISNYNSLKDELRKIPNVAYCGLSVSGKGYWMLIPIAYPEKHREHCKALERAFKLLGINIDTTCKDVCRLRGYSYDSDAYFNHKAVPFRSYVKPERYKLRQTSAPLTDEAKAVEFCLQELEKANIDLTNSYESWFSIGCAFANSFKEDGREFFHRVSQFHQNYSTSETDRKYDECMKGYDYGLGTFFYYCNLQNIKPPREEVNTDKEGESRSLLNNPGQEQTKKSPISITSDQIVAVPVDMRAGHDFDNLIVATLWMQDARRYDILYDKNGELIDSHPQLPALSSFFNKSFVPGTLDGNPCLVSVVN